MSVIAAARSSAMPSPTCSRRPVMTVTREYYINDAGAQVDTLARSAYLRYREALGRDDRRDPARPLSRRLSEAGRRSLEGGVRRRAAASCRGGMAAGRARAGHRGHDGDDPRRPRSARHPPRRVLLRAVAAIRRPVDRVAEAIAALAREGPDLPGHAAAAEGPGAGGLGGPGADACSAPPSSATTSTGR